MAPPFRTTRRVEFADTDLAGIVHFARFFAFMEEAEHEFLRSRGLSVVMTHQGRRIGWPRVAASCDFLKPAFFEDVVTIDVTLSRIGGKSLTFTAEFTKNADVLARGKLTTCCCVVGGPQGVTPIDLPDDLRRKLEGPPVPAEMA